VKERNSGEKKKIPAGGDHPPPGLQFVGANAAREPSQQAVFAVLPPIFPSKEECLDVRPIHASIGVEVGQAVRRLPRDEENLHIGPVNAPILIEIGVTQGAAATPKLLIKVKASIIIAVVPDPAFRPPDDDRQRDFLAGSGKRKFHGQARDLIAVISAVSAFTPSRRSSR